MQKLIDLGELPPHVAEAIENLVNACKAPNGSAKESVCTEEQASGSGQLKPGWLKGKFSVPDSFYEPLPEDVIALFEGRTPNRGQEK